MKTSKKGIDLIEKREGVVLHVYKDSKGLPTAGVGHLITAEEHANFPVGKSITKAQSDAWLTDDLKDSEDAVNSLDVNLEQNEFDALVSLTFNIGVHAFEHSTVARKLKAGDMVQAAKAILLWNKPPEIQGRRRTEYNQFLTPYKDSAGEQSSSVTATDNHSETPDGSNNPPPSTATETQVKQEVDTTTTTVTAKNEQDVSVPAEVQSSQPYMGVGFWTIIRKDIAKLGVSNLGIQSVVEYREEIEKLGIPSKILLVLGVTVLVASGLYLLARLIHYLIWIYKEHQRMKIEAAVNTAINKKDMKWT